MKLYPSVMCMNADNLCNEVIAWDQAGVDGFHVDIADGTFVPNCVGSIQEVSLIRSLTSKPLCVHLMVKEPDLYLPSLYNLANVIYVHFEIGHSREYVNEIQSQGIKAGLAVGPCTPLENVRRYLLQSIDYLLILRVKPGFAGQKPVDQVESKIDRFLQSGYPPEKILLDGAVSRQVAHKWFSSGIRNFVCGVASGFFRTDGVRSCPDKYQIYNFKMPSSLNHEYEKNISFC